MDLAAARTSLAALIAPVVTCLPHIEPDPTAPVAMVLPSTPFVYAATFEESYPFNLTVILLAGALSARSGQLARLDVWLSPGDGSVVDAVNADGRFGVSQLLTYGVTSLADGGTQFWGASLEVICYSA
jgi:hypothetical protein